MKNLIRHLYKAVLVAVLMSAAVSLAQNIPEHAQGLNEELVSVDLSENKKQVGEKY